MQSGKSNGKRRGLTWSLGMAGLVAVPLLTWYFNRTPIVAGVSGDGGVAGRTVEPSVKAPAPPADQTGRSFAADAVSPDAPARPADPGSPAQAADPDKNPSGHPSDALLATARLAREQWSEPDPAGNRERIAVFQTEAFKYPWLRVVEKWSGKTGRLVTRRVMVADHVLVTPRPGLKPGLLQERLARAGLEVRDGQSGNFVLAAFVSSVTEPSELDRRIDAIAKLEDVVRFSEPDYIVWPCLEPNDPSYLENKLWGLQNRGGVSGYTADADIAAPEAWDVRTDASNVIVAVTDTGIRHDHQDLAPNMWVNPGETAGDGIDNDGNGVIDDRFGYDALNGDGDPMDDQGHGTHCAGTIGARGNNGTGMTGVAWNVRLMGGKFLGSYGGTTSDAIKAIDYSRGSGAHVISASWGGGGYSDALYQAISRCAASGIPFVAAAGNSGVDNDSSPHYPSSYNLPNIVAVAATDATDNLTYFSCYGRNSVDIAAPGWQIWSCYKNSSSDYKYLQGTSMATPHVSGALALARAQFPLDSVDELITRLHRSADAIPALEGKIATGGRLNLYRLLTGSGSLPGNDLFDDAQRLTGDHASWGGSNQKATRETDEAAFSPAVEERTLWFAWQAPYEGFVTLTTDSLGAGQRIVVFQGVSRSDLKVVMDTGANPGGPPRTVARFFAEAGVEYRMVTASGSAGGEILSLELELTAANDLLSQAWALSGESFEFHGSNRGATAQPFESVRPHAGVGAGQSVWFRWTAPFTGPMHMSTFGSGTDTVLAVYTGDPSNPSGFVETASNDDANAQENWSELQFEAIANTVYHIAVDTLLGGTAGGFVLQGTQPGPPVITSEPGDRELVLGARAVLSVGASGSPPLRYQWFRNGTALPGAWDRSLVIDPVTVAALGDYHVTVRNSFGHATSRTARLTEKPVAPEIVWSSGDQSALAGTAIQLRVETRGSDPLEYVWQHNGVPIPDADAASLAIPALSAANAGIYDCTVSNLAGSATASMKLTLVSSPFDSWEWRLDAIPGPAVTDMKVIDGSCYAVTGDRIMVSEDGIQWRSWLLPAGFDGVSLSKAGNRWLCTGMSLANSGRCAISTDGVNWTLHTPVGLTGTDGSPSSPLQHVVRLESFNGRFLGQTAKRGTIYGKVVTSSDGIAWTDAVISGTSTTLSVNGPFTVGPLMAVTGNGNSGALNDPARAYRTTDGVNWTLFSLPANTGVYYDKSRGACRWNDQFVLFSGGGNNGWVSADGINWTLQTGKSWPGGIDFNGDFVSLGGAQYDGVSVAWADTPWIASNVFVKPATGDIISAYVSFNNRVIYGTQRGFLGHLAEPEDLRPFGGNVAVPGQMVFADSRFFALQSSTNGVRSASPLVSGDGGSWRPMRPWTWDGENRVAAFQFVGFGAGQFWGEHGGYDALGPAKGLLPHVMPEIPISNGLPKTVQSLAADGDTLLAIASGKLYRSTDGGAAWQQVTGAPVIGGSYNLKSQVLRSGSLWLLTNAAATYSYETGFVHYSSDGLTWTKTTGRPGYITSFNGKLFGLEANMTSPAGTVKGWESLNNGVTWTAVTFHATYRFDNMDVRQLDTFANSLVALVYSRSDYQTSVYFSNDGRSWFRANTPRDLAGFATGLGQFVGYTTAGAIVQAGSQPAGGSAPVVRANYPVHLSAAVAGSWVDVIGEAFDPEGAAVTLECRVDGQLIGSSGAGTFGFRFRAENPAGHTVILRATDPAGLVGSDELRVTVTPPHGTNLIESAEGRDYLPRVALVEFNGTFYAAGQSGIQRSPDGIHWEPVLLPSLSSKLVGLAAGNGSLVAQTEWGVLYSTRDGTNWVQIGLATYAGYWIHQPIIFSGGRFLVLQQVSGQIAVNYRTSTNGIDWESAGVYTSARQAVIGDNGVIISIHENSSIGDKAVWSSDGGNNWTAIPGIARSSGQNLAFAMTYVDGLFLIAASDGRVWRSSDGRVWAMGNLPSPPASGVSLNHAGGRIFAGSSSEFLFTSTDGVSWLSLTMPVRAEVIIQDLGRYIARGQGGMMWSQNGVEWKNAQGGPSTTIGRRLAANAEQFLVIDANGAAWSSANGVVWRQDFAGLAGATDTSGQLGQQMARFKGAVLLAGTKGMLAISDTDGASWVPATADGLAVPVSWHFNRIQATTTTALATAAISTNSEKVVLRSGNGRSWQQIPALAAQRIVDVAGDGAGTWLAVGANGVLFRSTDDAINWQQVTGLSMAASRAVAWFKNEWQIYGALTSGGESRTWSSPNGLAWTDRGANGLVSTNNDFFRVEAHGRLVVWNRTDRPVITSDGRSWQPFRGYQTFVGNSLYWVVPSATGFTLATPFISSQAPVQMFRGSADGQTWTEVPRVQNDTVWAASFENRLFLFAPGRVVEWPDRDIEIELLPPPPATLGVGDVLQCPAVLRNLGMDTVAGPLEVDGWISADGFFGDGNDVYLGRVVLAVSAPAPGAEVSTMVRFELPGKIRPGSFRLIAVLDPQSKIRERNRSNNVSVSATAVASIPQRKLDVFTIGNGTVSSDQFAEYHPHGARIAFVALPGKGARFAGWGGDALGALSETMVILDSDKTVLANFVSTASLSVFTRGGGSVEQSAEDGIYPTGGTAMLQAVPLPGWTFTGWSGHLAGTDPNASLAMGSNKVVSANFTLSLESWTQSRFSSAQLADLAVSGAEADPDGDQLVNWREWLRGSHPLDSADRGQSTPHREGRWWVMTYSRMETFPSGHGVRCQASTDLAGWNLPVDERMIGSSNGIETIEARIDVTALPNIYLRIADTRP